MTDATREALTPAEHVEVLRYKLFCQLRANASLEKCSETWREIDAALQQPEAAEPVAYRYRWKIDGEWTSWHVSDASQNPEYFSSLEEEPLYTAPPASADMREALEKIEQLNPLAIEALEVHQTQLDQDGVMVGVSRQAVDEVVAAVKALRQALSRDGTKSEGGVDWDDVRGIAPLFVKEAAE